MYIYICDNTPRNALNLHLQGLYYVQKKGLQSQHTVHLLKYVRMTHLYV